MYFENIYTFLDSNMLTVLLQLYFLTWRSEKVQFYDGKGPDCQSADSSKRMVSYIVLENIGISDRV